MKYFTSELSFSDGREKFSVKDTQIRKWNTSESRGFSLSSLFVIANSVCNKNVLMTEACLTDLLNLNSCRGNHNLWTDIIIPCNPPPALDSSTVPSEGNCRSRALSFQLKVGNLRAGKKKKKKKFYLGSRVFQKSGCTTLVHSTAQKQLFGCERGWKVRTGSSLSQLCSGETVSVFSLADFGLCKKTKWPLHGSLDGYGLEYLQVEVQKASVTGDKGDCWAEEFVQPVRTHSCRHCTHTQLWCFTERLLPEVPVAFKGSSESLQPVSVLGSLIIHLNCIKNIKNVRVEWSWVK